MGSMFSKQQPEAPQTTQPTPNMSEKSMIPAEIHKDTPIDAALWKSLIDLRNDDLTQKWEALDADGISSWHSKRLVLHGIDGNAYYQDWKTVNQGYHEYLSTVKSIKVVETQSFGTPWFTSKENFVESVNKDGSKGYMRETVLAFWRWEGPGAAWTGDLSATEAGYKGWKIFEQHDYEIFPEADSEGVKVRIFPTKYF